MSAVAVLPPELRSRAADRRVSVRVSEAGFSSATPSPSRRFPAGASGVNARLLDAILRHRHWLLMAENGVIRDLVGPLREARKSLLAHITRVAESEAALGNLGLLMDQRRKFLIQRVDEVLRIAEAESLGVLNTRLLELAEKERAIQARLLRNSLPSAVQLDLVGPDTARLRAITRQPLGGKVYADRFRENYGEMRHAMRTELQTSFVLGEGMDAAGARIATAVEGIGLRRSVLIARSEIQRVANSTALAVYRRNRDVIGGLQWIATLDSRTCLLCGSLDSEFYGIENPPKDIPPLHPACRCYLSPVTRSWEDMGIQADELTPTTRASMDGQVPASTDYRAWFGTQSPDFQRGVLGKSRFEAFKGGDLEIKDFVDVKSNRIINVGQLPLNP